MSVGGVAGAQAAPGAGRGSYWREGTGTPFANGRGAPMREWVALGPDDAADLDLAREALAFVREG